MRIILALLLVVSAMVGCKSSTAPSAKVEFVQWTSYGSNGATGIVKNNGGATAHHVWVRTQTSYESYTSNATPFDLAPGATATFDGAGSGPGVIAPPTILKIGWD